jgi:hypothetical protein
VGVSVDKLMGAARLVSSQAQVARIKSAAAPSMRSLAIYTGICTVFP